MFCFITFAIIAITITITIIQSYCDSWLEQCKDDYFTMSEVSGKLAPCMPTDLICSPLKSIVPT